MRRILLCPVLLCLSIGVQAAGAVEIPSTKTAVSAPNPLLPPPSAVLVKNKQGQFESLPHLPLPGGGQSKPSQVARVEKEKDGGGERLPAALKTATRGMFVAAILGDKAILRVPEALAGASQAGASAGATPSAPGAAGASTGQSGGRTTQRLKSIRVADGETVDFLEGYQLSARVTESEVTLYLVGKNRVPVFVGCVDSIADETQDAPVAADTAYMQRMGKGDTK